MTQGGRLAVRRLPDNVILSSSEHFSLPFLDIICQTCSSNLVIWNECVLKTLLPTDTCPSPLVTTLLTNALSSFLSRNVLWTCLQNQKMFVNMCFCPEGATSQYSYPLNIIHKKSYPENVKDRANYCNCEDVVEKRIVTIPYYPDISEKMGRIIRHFNFRVSCKLIVKVEIHQNRTKTRCGI